MSGAPGQMLIFMSVSIKLFIKRVLSRAMCPFWATAEPRLCNMAAAYMLEKEKRIYSDKPIPQDATKFYSLDPHPLPHTLIARSSFFKSINLRFAPRMTTKKYMKSL